ncbi:putative Nuclear fragile X mental retardation-interacting protein 1 [Hypsibius exemplaris]|uniref:Nuclear fragile X mental retardation-interacting protein 1 n=1 Tax=Hypsibius exemplaris TaxID=2072580 RepID=A0A1W0X143_HYPEX|nr:putative Nuclear fragile X mental retardation-interacting protein 1 [Hypsibius exemplaris]
MKQLTNVSSGLLGESNKSINQRQQWPTGNRNSVAARGAALWNDQQSQNSGNPLPAGNGHQFSGGGFRTSQFRGGQQHRGGFHRGNGNRGGNRSGHGRGGNRGFRGSAFPNTRGSMVANPAPGLFRAPPVEYYCETCDMDFRNQQKLDDHTKNHVKCPKCDFVGVFDTIEEHFEMIHLTLIKNSLKPVETEEELKQWRDERKARFPRVKPVKAKAAVRPLPPVTPRTLAHGARGADLSEGEIEEESVATQAVILAPSGTRLSMLEEESVATPAVIYAPSGTRLSMLEEESVATPAFISAPSGTRLSMLEEESVATQAVIPAPSSTLLSMLGCYGESDSDSEPPDEIPCIKTTRAEEDTSLRDGPVPVPSAVESLSDLKDPVVVKPEAMKEAGGKVLQNRPAAMPNQRQRNQPYRMPVRRKPRTLYEKLVAKDMERDNDRLLQCLSHIVATNFLGMGAAPPSS